MNSKTTVGDFMTRGAHSIGQQQTMEEAHKLMRNHRIRHLPVLHGGKLVGMVTERDLHLMESLKEVNPAEVTVEDAMSLEVYTVSEEAPLAEVASVMHRRKLGSAVITDARGGKVIGVFTTTDALRALSSALTKAPGPTGRKVTTRLGKKTPPRARARS